MVTWGGVPTLFKNCGTWVPIVRDPISAKIIKFLFINCVCKYKKGRALEEPPLNPPLTITSLPGDAYYLSVTHNAEPQNAILIYPQC